LHPPRRSLMRIPIVLFTTALVSLTAMAVDVTTLSGKAVSGKPVSFDGQVLTLQTAAGPESVPVKDLLILDFGNKNLPIEKYDELILTDGSSLKLIGLKIKVKQLETTFVTNPPTAPKVTLPLNQAFSLLRGAETAKTRDDWKKLLDTRGKRDLFVSRAADSAISPLPGTVIEGSADGDSVIFEREDGQRTTLQLRRATGGIVFNPPPLGIVPPTIGQSFDIFGNTLFMQAFEIKGEAIAIKTVHGATFEYPNPSALVRLDFTQGNITALSSLDPVVNAPKPIPGDPYFTFLRDKSQDNQPIRLGGQVHAKGVWIAPDVTLTYKLTGDFREFKSTIGVDDGIELPSSQVKLTIEGDGRSLFNGLVTRKDPPRDLVLDVKGVRELKITVSQSSQYNGNQVTLASARLQK
jgi:hypothetical protein